MESNEPGELDHVLRRLASPATQTPCRSAVRLGAERTSREPPAQRRTSLARCRPHCHERGRSPRLLRTPAPAASNQPICSPRRWRPRGAHLATTAPPEEDQRTIEVRDAVSRLSPELRELIGLIHWDGFSIADAAAVIGIPASTARTRYQTARRQLAQSLTAVDPSPDVSVP